MRAVLGKQMELPDKVWTSVNAAWAAFFALFGGLNLYVAHNYSTDTWVNFKLFGFAVLMFIFVIGQALILSRYVVDTDSDSTGKP